MALKFFELAAEKILRQADSAMRARCARALSASMRVNEEDECPDSVDMISQVHNLPVRVMVAHKIVLTKPLAAEFLADVFEDVTLDKVRTRLTEPLFREKFEKCRPPRIMARKGNSNVFTIQETLILYDSPTKLEFPLSLLDLV